MWIMMIISFITVSYLDTKGFRKFKDKRTLVFYTILMATSCLLGIANGYARHMPSPADFIEKLILSLLGK